MGIFARRGFTECEMEAVKRECPKCQLGSPCQDGIIGDLFLLNFDVVPFSKQNNNLGIKLL